MSENTFVDFHLYHHFNEKEMEQRAENFRKLMQYRRSIRHFSDKPVPRKIIEDCLLTAGTAPSGANRQPWHFVVVNRQKTKKQIREAAEKEEYEFYHGRAGEEWLSALSHLGTDHQKPYLETAPYLIAIFAKVTSESSDGTKQKNYYIRESVGIATGMLVTAIHQAGLVSLTYTPSPMGFLNDLLKRPKGERPFLLLVVGYPADNARVPVLTKKTLHEIATFIE